MITNNEPQNSVPVASTSPQEALQTVDDAQKSLVLDEKTIRKIGLVTSAISFITIPGLIVLWMVVSSWLYAIAGGKQGFMWDTGTDPESWYVPIFIMTTLLFIIVSVLTFWGTHALLKKRYTTKH